MRHFLLATVSLVSMFIISCAEDSVDDCAFQTQDGSCAVVVSATGALECKLDDAALCETMTTFLDTGEESVRGTSAALIGTGGGGGTSLYCEPDGTFMCTCCSVKAGCYPCPTKPKGSILRPGDAQQPSRSIDGP